jgi:hypothetical protein
MKRINSERPSNPATTDAWRDAGQEDRLETRDDGLSSDVAAMRPPAQPEGAEATVEDGHAAAHALPPMVFPGPYAYGPGPALLHGERAPACSATLLASGNAAMGVDVAAFAPLPDEPAFVHAARVGHRGLVREWLDAGIDVNLCYRRNGNTALMVAACNGHGAVVRHLLTQPGIAIDLLNANGHSALTIAVGMNRSEVVRHLLDAGADVNLPNKRNRMTALMAAAEMGSHDIVRILLQDPRTDPNRCDADGRTALMFAADSNEPDIVEWLLAANASTARLDRFDESAYAYAFRKYNTAVIEVLFRHGRQRDPELDPKSAKQYPKSFSAAVGDLWMDLAMPAPALPAREEADLLVNGLVDILADHKKPAGKMLGWLVENGIRWAYAHQIVGLLCKTQASWQTHGDSRPLKLSYCLSAISVLPALGGTGKILALYRAAGMSAPAIERLGDVASSQLTWQANLALEALAAIGSELMNTLVDDCMASIGLNGVPDQEKLMAALLDKGYCAPVAQTILRSWQDTMAALGQMTVAVPENATFSQHAAMLHAYTGQHAPTLFAQKILHTLASHEVLHQLTTMQGSANDEGLHAQFQVQCDWLRQFSGQLLDSPTHTANTTSTTSPPRQ